MGHRTNRFGQATKLAFRGNKINELLDETRPEGHNVLQGWGYMTLLAEANGKVDRLGKFANL